MHSLRFIHSDGIFFIYSRCHLSLFCHMCLSKFTLRSLFRANSPPAFQLSIPTTT